MSEGTMTRDGNETWYRVVGDLDPGAAHARGHLPRRPGRGARLLRADRDLSRFGRAVRPLRPVRLREDGTGPTRRRTSDPAALQGRARRPDAPPGDRRRYAVVGQSWGGMLAMEHALDHPDGLRGIVVADSPGSMPLWVVGGEPPAADLPPDVQATLTRHEEAGTTDDPEYEAAVRLLRPPSVPRALARLRRAELRADRGGPDRLPHDERPERVPLHRLAEDVGHHRPAARDHDADALVSGRYDEATPHIVEHIHSASRARSGRSSRSRATCRTSRSRRLSSRRWRRSSKTVD